MKNKIIAMLCTFSLSISTAIITTPAAATAADNIYPTTHDEYVEMVAQYPDYYRIDEDSVYFFSHGSMETNLIVSSNENSDITYNKYGYVFTPEDTGRYVVTVSELRESIIRPEPDTYVADDGSIIAYPGLDHHHVFYNDVYNYTIDVDESGISVVHKGSYTGVAEEAGQTTALYKPWANIPYVDKRSYISFVSGQLPSVSAFEDSYITTVYTPYTTKSYFYMSWTSMYDVEIPPPESSDTDVAALTDTFFASSYCDGNLMISTSDEWNMYEFRAISDGNALITFPYAHQSIDLTVKDGVFHHVPKTVEPVVQYGIGVAQKPDKTVYKIGEELELNGLRLNGSITTIYEGVEERACIINEDYFDLAEQNPELSIDDSDFDNTQPGTYKIAVKFGNTQDFFNVTVTNERLIAGDVNDDGNFAVSDMVMFQKWLISDKDAQIGNWQAADVCKDGELNVFDLCAMKRRLLNESSFEDIDAEPVLFMEHDWYMMHEGDSHQRLDQVITSTGKSYTAPAELIDYPCVEPFDTVRSYCQYVIGNGERKDLIQDWALQQKINDISKNGTRYAESYAESKMLDCQTSIMDYGTSTLYLLYKDENNKTRMLQLAEIGEHCKIVDDPELQEIVFEMMKKRYFGDKTLYNILLEENPFFDQLS